MAWQDYLNVLTSGLLANLPSTVDNPEVPRFYLCTDTGDLYVWVPVTVSKNIPSPFTTPPVGGAWQLLDSNGASSVIQAAGQTQGTATAITGKLAIVTAVATATHNGVKLPTPSTGRKVTVVNGQAGGFKVYPALHNFIQGNASNVADTTNVAGFKANVYIGVNKTTWAVQRGA